MEAAEEDEFEDPRDDLGGADQGGGGDRRIRAHPRQHEKARHVGRHRAGDEPGRREDIGEQHTPPVDPPPPPPRGEPPAKGRAARDSGEIERQAEAEMKSGPYQAGAAPANMRREIGRKRPAHRRGEARKESDAGDRPARLIAIKGGERGEGRIVEPAGDPHAEHRPGEGEPPEPFRRGEQEEPCGEDQVGGSKHAAPAAGVDPPPDARAEQGGDEQGG